MKLRGYPVIMPAWGVAWTALVVYAIFNQTSYDPLTTFLWASAMLIGGWAAAGIGARIEVSRE